MDACILCGEHAITTAYTAGSIAGRQFSVGQCDQCGLVFSLPVLTEQDLNAYYAPQYYGRRKLVFDSFINSTRARYLMLLVPKNAAVLDIGCGSGSFLAMMRRRGMRVAGTELSSRKDADDREADIPVVYAPLWDAGFPPASFHAVTFWHTLEHMADPARYMRSAYEALVPGGILIAEMPNMASWQARVGQERWFHLDVPRHTVHFTPDTIRLLLEKTGFAIVRIRYASFFYDVFGWVQTLLNAVTRRQNVLFDLIGGRIRMQDHIRDSIATVLLLPVIGPAAFVLHILGRFFRSSSVMIVYAKKI